MSKLHQLAKHGQSFWLDYMRRSLITSGELQALIDMGLRGLTSNPTIFEKAIAGSMDYDEDFRRLVDEGRSVKDIYEELALEDISRSADILRPVYEETGGVDGYVSLEVSPSLANDTAGTINEARRLFTMLGKENVMIKVPATPEGIPAIETLIADGINVNVTLLFSLNRYTQVVEAYLSGMEKLRKEGREKKNVASVASFFVSRVDTAVDSVLEKIGNNKLRGTIAIANAKLAYDYFKQVISSERWKRLAAEGARPQRLLWASTATKNSAYSDTLYLDGLIGNYTVNTVPPATLQAFLDHGRVKAGLAENIALARKRIDSLAALGVDLTAITDNLLEKGVAAFAQSFEDLLQCISEKRSRVMSGRQHVSFQLGIYRAEVDEELRELKENRIISRIWAHDYTVWKPDPSGISNRLGWLHSPDVMSENVERIQSFAREVRTEGFTHAVLLGMGGSSLAAQMLRTTFGVKEGYLDLSVLDSTDPARIASFSDRLNPRRTLFIVSTKSGTTSETLSFFKFFYNRMKDSLGKAQCGKHFIAITDPDSPLTKLAKKYSFRGIFINDPTIGGRYSALSYFGLIPAGLIGVDLKKLLGRALVNAVNCEASNCPVSGNNFGAGLGVVLGVMAMAGRDKLTFVESPEIERFADWVEQLIAESTGKEGKGILPVVREGLGTPLDYGQDRLFVHIALERDKSHADALTQLEDAGYPIVKINLHDLYDLGGQFFLWEMATAVAGHILGINPFDQPDVEAAKVLAADAVNQYRQQGVLPQLKPVFTDDRVAIFGDIRVQSAADAIHEFLSLAGANAYFAIQAYIAPSAEISEAMLSLRLKIRNVSTLATTFGYGPRFLHSTGQLHKGDAGTGLFLQITSGNLVDLPIPDEAGSDTSSMSFGVLESAQALGDWHALKQAGRMVMRIHFEENLLEGIKKIL